MIEGKGWKYVEIPYTENGLFTEVLLEQKDCKPLTPPFDPVVPETNEYKQPQGDIVFTFITKPFKRMEWMYEGLKEDNPDFIEWQQWMYESRGDHVFQKPYSYWCLEGVKVFRIEDFETHRPLVEKIVGKLDISSNIFDYTPRVPFSKEECEYIVNTRRADFIKHNYSTDRRKKT